MSAELIALSLGVVVGAFVAGIAFGGAYIGSVIKAGRYRRW